MAAPCAAAYYYFPPLLFLFLFLVLLSGVAATSTIPAQRGRANTNVLKSTCNSTTYNDLCLAALAADPSSSTADVRGLCAIAVSSAAANASATAAALAPNKQADKSAQSSTEHAALLRSCATKYGEAREALLAARESVGEEAYDYAIVQVNAAAEYAAVCGTLFRRKREVYPEELARREEGLEHLCTVAIDIISLLA